MDTNQRERGAAPRRKPAQAKKPGKSAPVKNKPPAPGADGRSAAGRRTAKPHPAPSSKRRPTDSRERESVRARQRQAERRNRRKTAAPAVVYTEPMPFNRRRLLIQLSTVVAVVLALVLGMSLFFKVEVITVSGANVYSEWLIREKSGIQEGDSLLTFSRARAGARIRAELPYVDRVRIGIKLPNTVMIVVEELDVVYSIQDHEGFWWLITSEGRVVEQTDGGTAAGYTTIKGVTLDSPKSGEDAVALETYVPTESTEPEGEVIGTEPVVVTAAQQLDAALEILRALEANDVVGEAASVDVSNLQSILLKYGQRFDVKLGDTSQMSYKIACMVDAINDPRLANGYGELDVSFTIWTDQVGYTPKD